MATSNAATTFLEHRLLNFVFKNNAQVGGANFGTGNSNGLGDNLYVGLATAVSNFNDSTGESGSPSVTEATYSGYTRKQVTAGKWTLASSSADTQTVKNTNNIEWSPSTTDGTQTITHVFITSASSSGNIYFIGALDASKAIAEGDIFRINAENLVIELK